MEHTLLKAVTTTTTDEGTFEAVISTASVDREKDVVSPAGMVRALQKWAATGKKIPLAWNHSGAADQQVGYIDPASVKQSGSEVVASGYIDQSTDTGEHVWRLAKSGTLGFSFGYLILKGSARKGGGRNIDELDVFEVTATTTPMNNDTRVLGWKSTDELRRAANALEREIEEGQLPGLSKQVDEADDATEDPAQAVRDAIEELQEFVDAERQEGDPADVQTATRLLAALQQLLDAENTEPAKAIDPAEQDRRAKKLAAKVEREENDRRLPSVPATERAFAVLHITNEEMNGLAAGDLKAVWSAAYVNTLPDSAFLHVESGGTKDPDGKTTPRSLRHFPYKDDSGTVDLPHLRNALARIPQSNLSQTVKDQLTAKAQRILDAQKSVDVTDKEPKARSVDPLRQLADAVALEYASDGESRRKPPREKATPKPVPQLELDELRQRTRDETLIALSGVEDHE